ncbi:unnamed protein product [Calypogeia fissa]
MDVSSTAFLSYTIISYSVALAEGDASINLTKSSELTYENRHSMTVNMETRNEVNGKHPSFCIWLYVRESESGKASNPRALGRLSKSIVRFEESFYLL